MRRQALIVAGLMAVLSLAAVATSEKKPTGKWIQLFNGKDLTGWNHVGRGSFVVEDGALVTQAGMGLLYYETRSFRDFTLEVE